MNTFQMTAVTSEGYDKYYKEILKPVCFRDAQAKRTLKAQKLQEELASGKLEQVVSKRNPSSFLFRLLLLSGAFTFFTGSALGFYAFW